MAEEHLLHSALEGFPIPIGGMIDVIAVVIPAACACARPAALHRLESTSVISAG